MFGLSLNWGRKHAVIKQADSGAANFALEFICFKGYQNAFFLLIYSETVLLLSAVQSVSMRPILCNFILHTFIGICNPEILLADISVAWESLGLTFGELGNSSICMWMACLS